MDAELASNDKDSELSENLEQKHSVATVYAKNKLIGDLDLTTKTNKFKHKNQKKSERPSDEKEEIKDRFNDALQKLI